MQPLETFDPWSDTKNYAFTRKIVPFSEKYENPAFSISVEQLEPPCGPTYKSKGAKGGISKNRGAVSDSGSEVRLSNASMPSESRPKSLKSRLLAGFVGLKNRDDDEESESKSSSPNVENFLFSSTDFIVARFYYGNAAYTTLKLPRGTTVASAVQAVMDKLLIKDSADEYGLYIQRKNVDGACEIEKNQDVSAIVKSLKDTEMLLFKRKHRMESQLRSGVIDATVLSAASSVEPTSETSAQATGPQFSDDDEGCDMEKGRISVSQRFSKTGDAYLRARNLKRWTKTVEAKELCRVLGIFGTSKTVESDVFKQKKLVHQKLPKEGWLMIRDEFNEWVSVWVSVNSEEVKLLLSSLDATTYVFPSSRVMVHVSKTVENENGRHVFVIADRQNVGASFFVAAKTFVEMESWVERLKCFSGESSSELASSEHDSSPFQICRVYGESENGQLLLCEQKTTKQAFSVKIWKKSNKPTLDMELKILRAIRHSFIIKLHAIFETSSQSFLVLDYVDGGELYQQVSNFGKFTEDRARFYAAEILLALEFLHGHRIVYRGLALEKVFLNREGHVVISEFGTARMEHNSDVGLRVGQLEYLAPETLHGQGTSYATDWWALGIVLYEMMCASHPFFHEQKCQLEENILNTVLKFPKHLSANAKSVLSGLITRDTTKRLGSNGGEDILRNQFFDKLDVIRVANRETEAPWKPEVLDAMDEELLGEPELFDERDEGQLQ
ncbi:hypothetical protein HDU82_002808 [Entophlyctis luteolus]|nr:hypothetical protein HDU82_002808 [Entophlyctis luteolus]